MLHKSLLAQGHNCPHRAFFFVAAFGLGVWGKFAIWVNDNVAQQTRETGGKRARTLRYNDFRLSVARVRGPRGAGGRECVPEAEPVAVCVGCARPRRPPGRGPRAARRPMTDRQPRAACLCPGTRQPTRSIRSEDRSVHAHTDTVHMPLAPPHLNTSTATQSHSHTTLDHSHRRPRFRRDTTPRPKDSVTATGQHTTRTTVGSQVYTALAV